MTPVLRKGWVAGWVIVFCLLLSWPVAAAPGHQRYYKTGLTAAKSEDWQQVEKMMRRAIEGRSAENRRRVLRRGGYFPHFYLGLARYFLGDCSGALASWAESEDQGAIVGRDEYAELLRLQADCERDGVPSFDQRASASQLSGKRQAGKEARDRKSGKEKVRTGQHWAKKGADPIRKALGILESVAPEDSDLGKAARQGQGVVDVLEAASDIADLLLSPSETLEAAIDAYFAGDPQRTLKMLQGINLSDPRARAQVYLFRAAASFRLHLLAGRGDVHAGTARKNADLFQQAQWRDDFPAELFDPRFVRFLRSDR